jgi:hypothetical protein
MAIQPQMKVPSLMTPVAKLAADQVTGTGYTAQTGIVAEKDTSAGRAAAMMTSGSPLMDIAKTEAKQAMNSTGTMNSSMAIGAGQTSMMKAAQPFAMQDSNLISRQNLTNQSEANSASRFGADATNAASRSNQAANLSADTANQAATNDASKFNADSQNKADTAQFSHDSSTSLQDSRLNHDTDQNALKRAQDKSLEQSRQASAITNNISTQVSAIQNNKDLTPEGKRTAIAVLEQFGNVSLATLSTALSLPNTGLYVHGKSGTTISAPTPAPTATPSTPSAPATSNAAAVAAAAAAAAKTAKAAAKTAKAAAAKAAAKTAKANKITKAKAAIAKAQAAYRNDGSRHRSKARLNAAKNALAVLEGKV